MKSRFLLMLAFVTLATGCVTAPKEPIPLASSYYEKPGSVAVYIEPAEDAAKMTLPGASCLLCLAAASVANSEVSTHVKTLSTEELKAVPDSIRNHLEEQGIAVEFVDLSEQMPRLPKFSGAKGDQYAKKNHRALRPYVNSDHLLVLEFGHVGIERTYSNYVPTSSPQGAVDGMLYLIDLSSNEYYLYEPLKIRVPVDGEWKEPDEFPGVTMAYFEALERAKIQVSEALEGQPEQELAGEDL